MLIWEYLSLAGPAVYSATTGECLLTLPKLYWSGNYSEAVLSPSGELVLSNATGSGGLKVTNIASGKCLLKADGEVHLWSFSADDRLVLTRSGVRGTEVHLWSIDAGRRLHKLVHGFEVTSACFSEDCTQVLSAGGKFQRPQQGPPRFLARETCAVIWNVSTGQRLHVLSSEQGIENARFLPNDGGIVTFARTSSDDTSTKLWTRAGECLRTLDRGTVVDFSPDGAYVVQTLEVRADGYRAGLQVRDTRTWDVTSTINLNSEQEMVNDWQLVSQCGSQMRGSFGQLFLRSEAVRGLPW